MIKKYIIIFFFFFSAVLSANEKSGLDLAKKFFDQKEYFHSISATLRYENYYPKGKYLEEILYIRGMSYLKGDDYSGAVSSFTETMSKKGESIWKQKSHIARGFSRLTQGAPFYAYMDFVSYLKTYEKGYYRDAATLQSCYALSLTATLYDSLYQVRLFYKLYPSSRYMTSAQRLEQLILFEMKRPKKNMLFAIMGSIILPGFGYLYTGNYELGFLSLGSNALMITAIVLSALQGNLFAVVFFSLLEVSLYQYQIFGAIKSVEDYNSNASFYKKVRFEITFPF
jgi:hypothetical protein